MTLYPELTVFLFAAVAALLVGVGKTGLPALSLVYNAIMFIAIPNKDAVGLVLLLLIIGDCFAVYFYRQHVEWKTVFKLLPSIVVGLLIGTFLLDIIPNDTVKPIVGLVVLMVLGLDQVQKRGLITFDNGHPVLAMAFGCIAGIATLLGNAAGSVMAIYLLLLKFNKQQFMGTSAWLFFIVNLSKVPLLMSIDVVTDKTFYSALFLIPFVVVGAICGKTVLKLIPLTWFSNIVTISALGSSSYFILEYALAQGWLGLG